MINDNDIVVFKSAVARGPSALGFFRWDRTLPENNRLSTLVRTGDSAPLGGAQTILDLPGEASINGNGDVAFAALVFDPDQGVSRGVFATGAGGMRRVAMPNDPLPFVAPDAQIEGIATNPMMLSDGSVAFRATYAYEDPSFFTLVREDGVFRVSPAGDTSILVSTLLTAPNGQSFFRFRDLNSSGGTIVVRASLGDSAADVHPNGLFLIDPSAAVRLVVVEHETHIGGNHSLDSTSGRASVDLAGNVAFLARLEDDPSAALIHATTDGNSSIEALVGGPGPNGGIVKSVGRPTLASNGHLAFRLGFERGTGQTSGFYLKRNGVVEPFIALDEADSDGVGDRLNSLNPIAALNSSDHLAFIASESAGDARNGIFFAAPATATVGKIRVLTKEKNVKGIPTLKARVRAKVDLDVSSIGKAIQPDKQAVKVTISDSEGPVFAATADNGSLRSRTAGSSRSSARRRAQDPHGAAAQEARRAREVPVRKFELPFRSGDKLRAPFTVGSTSASTRARSSSIAARRPAAALCPRRSDAAADHIPASTAGRLNAVQPRSQAITAPVMLTASSDARNTTMWAISSGVCRPEACSAANAARNASLPKMSAFIGVST